jgi:hypothetical protein
MQSAPVDGDGMPVWPQWLLEELMMDDSEDDSTDTDVGDEEVGLVKRGGSRPGRSVNKNRSRHQAAIRLHRDYFSPCPTYSDGDFRRRFRMRKPVFLRLLDGCLSSNPLYFEQRADACHVMGLSPFQKVTAALRMMAYGGSADSLDETMRMGEQTILDSLKHFCRAVINEFGDEYLRSPTELDTKRILQTNSKRGFPGMLGSLDCSHWRWKNCPKAWAGQYKGKEKTTTVVAEVVSTYDLWIWHLFFGMPGSNNDINILDRSPLFRNMLKGTSPAVRFVVNDKEYDMCYYLCDGIYPNFATLMKAIVSPQGRKRSNYTKVHESIRKDVERAFGVLQARWQIIDKPCKLWGPECLTEIFTAAVIMHNMIVEDERDDYQLSNQYLFEDDAHIPITVFPALAAPNTNDETRSVLRTMVNVNRHSALQADLVEHLWSKFGETDE